MVFVRCGFAPDRFYGVKDFPPQRSIYTVVKVLSRLHKNPAPDSNLPTVPMLLLVVWHMRFVQARFIPLLYRTGFLALTSVKRYGVLTTGGSITHPPIAGNKIEKEVRDREVVGKSNFSETKHFHPKPLYLYL